MCRKSTLAITIAATCFVVGCQKEVTSPAFALPGPSLAASSGGTELNTKVPLIDFAVFVPCANGGSGELVVLNGVLHTLLNITIDANGGLHAKTHSQPQRLSGVGLVTGAKYRGVGVTQASFNLAAGSTETFINNFRLIGQGPGNNFMVHENVHITVNANGTVTAIHDNLKVSCT